MALRPGPVLYGLLFAVALPVLLVLWARGAAPDVGLPSLHAPVPGWIAAASGLALVVAAMLDLWRRGGGLPMNAFPPPRLVTGGAYAVVGHPIYVGFAIAVAGVAVATGSAWNCQVRRMAAQLASNIRVQVRNARNFNG